MRIAVIPGDGIGVDVTAEAVKVMRAVGEVFGRTLDLEMLPYGADYYLQTGISLPPNGYAMLRDEFDAIYIGALGDPRIPDMRHARDILLGIRFELDLYVNHRPVRLLDARLCPLKNRGPRRRGFRRLSREHRGAVRQHRRPVQGGHRGRGRGPGGDQHLQRRAPDRQARVRIREGARPDQGLHGRQEQRHDARTRALAARVLGARREYPAIEPTHLYIDALAMQLVKNPAQFEVIVTNNMFGDIVTDLGAQLQGGLGMAASGNLHPGRTSMFEPVHGSAPKYAGKNVANPVGAILSAALMLEYLECRQEAAAIEAAVKESVVTGNGTAEIGGTLGTRETGDYIANAIKHPRL